MPPSGSTTTTAPTERAVPTGPAAERDLVRRLREAGVGRVSDAFFVPIDRDDGRQARRGLLHWREREREVWLRAAEVPFDLLTYRPGSPERSGGFFALGPGLTPDGELHPRVLQVQVEGPRASVEERVAHLRPLLERELAGRREASTAAPERDWVRVCIAGVVPRP